MNSVTIQVVVSLLIVAAVIVFMWRMPVREGAYFVWAPYLAISSAWAGLLSLIGSLLLFTGWLPTPDAWVVLLFLGLDPLAVGAGVLTHWVYRRQHAVEATVSAQLLQAKVGIALGVLSVAAGYYYVMTHKTPFSAVGV